MNLSFVSLPEVRAQATCTKTRVKEEGAGLKVAYGGESMRAYLARGLRAMNGSET